MFNDERRKNANFIFERMKRYYPTFETPDEVTIGEWIGVLDGYSQTEIMDALKNYRKNVPYNVAPNPASFKDYLPAKHKPVEEAPVRTELADLAWSQMNLDIENGVCRNNLYVYRDAERIILEDWLLHEVPAEVWRKMSYASRLKVATEKGLVGRFGEALTQAAQKRFGRDYEFLGASDLEAAKGVASRNKSENDGQGVIVSHERGGGFKPLAAMYRS